MLSLCVFITQHFEFFHEMTNEEFGKTATLGESVNSFQENRMVKA